MPYLQPLAAKGQVCRYPGQSFDSHLGQKNIRFNHTCENREQFKTYKLLTFRNIYNIFRVKLSN